jgi:hypothetical protein
MENGEQAALSGSELILQRPRVGVRHACRLTLAALVLAFAVLYLHLNAAGSCGEPGCPHFSHAPASVELTAATFVSLLAALPAAPVLARHFAAPSPTGSPPSSTTPPSLTRPDPRPASGVLGAGCRPYV